MADDYNVDDEDHETEYDVLFSERGRVVFRPNPTTTYRVRLPVGQTYLAFEASLDALANEHGGLVRHIERAFGHSMVHFREAIDYLQAEDIDLANCEVAEQFLGLLREGVPAPFTDDPMRLVRQLRDHSHLSSGSKNKMLIAEKELSIYSGCITGSPWIMGSDFSNRFLASLFEVLNSEPRWLKQDPGEVLHPGTFYLNSCARQLVEDIDLLPTREWMKGPASSIATTLLNTKSADTYKKFLAVGVPLPLALLGSELFPKALQDDFDLLVEAKNAMVTLLHARCFEAFFLRIRLEIFTFRADYYGLLRHGDSASAHFNLVQHNAYSLLAAMTKSLIEHFSENIKAIDKQTAEPTDKDEWSKVLNGIPGSVRHMEARVWHIMQDWMATIPQMALYHYERLIAKELEPGEFWNLNEEAAKGEGKQDTSWMRRESFKGVSFEWHDDLKVVILPFGRKYPLHYAKDVLEEHAELMAWVMPDDSQATEDSEMVDDGAELLVTPVDQHSPALPHRSKLG